MKKVAIYARVSTDKPEEQRTIESQLDRIREVCRHDGVRIVQEYLDDGVSGTTLAKPGLDRLRDDASKGYIQGIYILSPDRLARKYVYQALAIEELWKQEIQLTKNSCYRCSNLSIKYPGPRTCWARAVTAFELWDMPVQSYRSLLPVKGSPLE